MTLKVGIITPSYNQAQYIGKTIDSVLSQTRPVDYYAIYDACSSDGTAAILHEYSGSKNLPLIIIEKDHGQADAISRGLREMPANIDIMAYLNSDDILTPNCVEIVMGIFQRFPEVDLVTGWRQIIGPRGRKGLIVKSSRRSSADMLIDVGLNQETTFWRRSLYERAGGKLDVSFKFALDYELWLRMSESGWEPYYVPEVLGNFRIHRASKTTCLSLTTGLAELNRLRVMRNAPCLTHEELRAATTELRIREMGRFGAYWWRCKNQFQKRILLPLYL